MSWLILAVLAFAGGVVIQLRRPKGLRLPAPQLPLEPVAERQLTAWEISEIQRRQKAQAKMDAGKRAFALPNGMVWNPMRNYPRNAKCTCGSGKKFKACCLSSLPAICPAERADRLKGLVKLAESGVNVPVELAKAQARIREAEAMKQSAHPARSVGSA